MPQAARQASSRSRPSRAACAKGRLAKRSVSGRSASSQRSAGQSKSREGPGSGPKAAFRSSEMWPVAAVRVAKRAKGERRSEWLEAGKARASETGRQAQFCLRALTPRAFAVPHSSGGRASRNCQRERRLPARGLGASRRSVEAVRRGELREVASGRKAPGRFVRRCKPPSAQRSKGARRSSARRPPSPSRSPARRDA